MLMPRSKALVQNPSHDSPSRPARLATPRNLALIAFVLLTLIAIVVVAIVREAAPRRLTAPAITRTPQPSRPPLTREEAAYIEALWPIHGAVERSSARMSLGQIFYMTKDLKRTDLKARADEALGTYRRAGDRLRTLEPPPSLQRAHEDYTAAVRLFERSAVEVGKMFDDGRDDHMRIAAPFSREANDKIREVGVKFWPQEFPPN
jgi:hypothetical protein